MESTERKFDVSTIFEETISATLRTLQCLKSSDFDSLTGTNETGFKNIVISALQHYLLNAKECEIFSEQEVIVTNADTKQKVSKFADVVVQIGEQFGLIIELKYVQCPFLDGYFKNAKKLPFPFSSDTPSVKYTKMLERRKTLTSIAEDLAKMSAEDLRKLKFHEQFEKTHCLSVAERETSALKQVKEYQLFIPAVTADFKWYAATIVGVGSNLVYTCVDFEAFID